jgi:hypothetical protein
MPRFVVMSGLSHILSDQLCQTYPLPNSKTQSENKGSKKGASEPSIQGHVYLETRSSKSVQVDRAAGTVGFLANDRDYLHTEYLYAHQFSLHHYSIFIILMARVPLGYDQPLCRVNVENSSQTSKSLNTSFGLVGGKPTAVIGLSAGKLVGTMTGLADEEVCHQNLAVLIMTEVSYCPRLQCHGLCLLNIKMINGRVLPPVTVHSVQPFIDHLLGNIKLQNTPWFPTSR